MRKYLFLLVIPLLIAAAAWQQPSTLTLRELNIVDKNGVNRITMLVKEDAITHREVARIEVRDPKGMLRNLMTSDEAFTFHSFYDVWGRLRVVVGEANQQSFVRVRSEKNNIRMTIGEDETATLVVAHGNSPRFAVYLDAKGNILDAPPPEK